MNFRRAFAALALLATTLAAAAADRVERQAVTFAEGAPEAVMTGAIKGYDSTEYSVPAGAGQKLAVILSSDSSSVYFNVFAPGDVPGESTALFNGARSGTAFKGSLDRSGDYTVQVFLIRAAARRAESADYTLTIAVTGTTDPAAEATPELAPDFADGLMGGPDYWQVTGAPNGSLPLRAVPGDGGSTKGTATDAAIVRNLGCRMVEDDRWCQVEQTGGATARGWVPGRYLRESTVAPSGDGGATSGALPCAWRSAQTTASCPFEAAPRGQGASTVTITRPNGERRRIDFEAGRAVASNLGGAAPLTSTRRGTTTLVAVGIERYDVPDAAIWGN